MPSRCIRRDTFRPSIRSRLWYHYLQPVFDGSVSFHLFVIIFQLANASQDPELFFSVVQSSFQEQQYFFSALFVMHRHSRVFLRQPAQKALCLFNKSLVYRYVTDDLFVIENGFGRQYEFVRYGCSPPVPVLFFAKNFDMNILPYLQPFINANMHIFTAEFDLLCPIFGTYLFLCYFLFRPPLLTGRTNASSFSVAFFSHIGYNVFVWRFFPIFRQNSRLLTAYDRVDNRSESNVFV